MKNRLLIATVNFLIQADRGHLSDLKTHIPEITYNNARTYKNGKKAPDGIEIRFGKVRPSEAVRKVLVQNGFRYSERQSMWYGFDNEETREFIAAYVSKGVEVDDTQYEKLHFWAMVKSVKEYERFYNRTEFQLRSEPVRYYYTKSQLEKAEGNVSSLVFQRILYFKKFYNKVIQEEGTDSEDEPAVNHLEIANRLKALADNMTGEISKKLNPPIGNQRPTARRSRIANGIREEGLRLQQIQHVLYGLSQAHKEQVITDQYDMLDEIRTKKQVELLMMWKNNEAVNKRFFELRYDEFNQLGMQRFEDWTEAIQQRNQLLGNYPQNDVARQTEKELTIKRLEAALLSKNIPGFFPTPPDLIRHMIELADLNAAHTILEPSAGKGDIIDAVKQQFEGQTITISAIEINSALREILQLKGHTIIGYDFLNMERGAFQFDRILMNPPFEQAQDVDHVVHALHFLKPGGKLVSIMGEGTFFRKYKKETAFRMLLKEKNAYVSEPIRDAFKNAFNRTGIAVRIVVIEEGTQASYSDDDTRILELEAEAEAELVKLRIELARKRKPVNGMEGLTFELDNTQDWNVLNFK